MEYTIDNVPYLGTVWVDGEAIKSVISFNTQTREIVFNVTEIGGNPILCKVNGDVDFLTVKYTPVNSAKCRYISTCGKHSIQF